MAQYRVQCTAIDTGSPVRDQVVNTFYLDTDVDLPLPGDANALADDAATLWATARDWPAPFDTMRVRIYNMADDEPREPVADRTKPITTFGNCGPREVAVCLSYYADRNLPRRRGRLFIGPWTESVMKEQVPATQRTQLQNLANGISGLGGINVQWVQYSPRTGEFHNVTDWWVDDEWDTVRSRGKRATTRLKGTVSG